MWCLLVCLATLVYTLFLVVEVLGGASLDQQVSSYMLEVLADDTSPNSISSYVVEVLADSTDPAFLTSQQIIWFFNDH